MSHVISLFVWFDLFWCSKENNIIIELSCGPFVTRNSGSVAKVRPVEAEGDLADGPDDEDDPHEEEDEADDGERHHLEHAVVLVRRPVARQQRGLKEGSKSAFNFHLWPLRGC